MSRKNRYLPKAGTPVEISQRMVQGRYLLKPSKRLNALFVGCLAKAQKLTGAAVHAVAVLSNHFHLLATFATVEEMSTFMCHFKTNLSKEIGRLYDWEGSAFAGRYKSIPLSEEEEIQIDRLRYILSQGTKEGLVLSPKDWPGVHCAEALIEGRALEGVWVDRTKLYAARQKDANVCEEEFTSVEELQLTPVPALEDLSPKDQKASIAGIVEEIEVETLERHRREGTAPAGVSAILSRDPHHRPKRLKKSPEPYFHAATKAARQALMEGFREFMLAYRAAAERLAAGDLKAVFPGNCYPPGLPFVEPVDA